MKAYVDQLSSDLVDRYRLYLETFMVDLWSADGMIEFRVGYSLRTDHILRDFVLKVAADEAVNDVERRAIIAAIFVEIEDCIDAAVAENRVETN